jgi:hypothetical protein
VATEEVTREEPTVSFVSSVDILRLMEEPIAGEYVGPLSQQPSLMALDEEVGLPRGSSLMGHTLLTL